MEIDLPMYRPGSLGRSEEQGFHIIGVIIWLMKKAQKPVDLPALTDILRSAVIEHLKEKQPSNPFANVGPDRLAAFVDSNPELKERLEAILVQNQSNARVLLRPIVAFCKQLILKGSFYRFLIPAVPVLHPSRPLAEVVGECTLPLAAGTTHSGSYWIARE